METRNVNVPRGPSCWAHIPVVKGVGALLIVGGGGTPPLVHDLFFHLAGDGLARLIHIPSATRLFEEIPNKEEYYSEFYGRNPASFAFLHTYDRAVAELPEFAAPLDRATGVWIGGGTQSRLTDLFLGTEVVPAIHRVVERGGVVAGTSSGTAIMSDAMICHGYEEIEFGPGFALYPRAVVDPHFTDRQREKRVARAALLRPDHIAIGIDERTALLVQGNVLGMVGSPEGSAWFHFAAPAGRVVRYRLRVGELIELPTPVRGADPRVLEECLRALRPADVITAEELVPEPEPGAA
jgi:cyanophycinase